MWFTIGLACGFFLAISMAAFAMAILEKELGEY